MSSLVSFSLIGSLLAFLYFKLWKKVFMGNTGSMAIGFLNQNPFKANQSHIHHCFLNLGFTHLKITMLISLFSVLITVFAYTQKYMDMHLHLIVVFILEILLILLLFWITKMTSFYKKKANAIITPYLGPFSRTNIKLVEKNKDKKK